MRDCSPPAERRFNVGLETFKPPSEILEYEPRCLERKCVWLRGLIMIEITDCFVDRAKAR